MPPRRCRPPATISLSSISVHKPASRSSSRSSSRNSVPVCHGALKSIIVAAELRQKAAVRWRPRLRAGRAVSTAVKEQNNRPCAVMVSALDCLASFVRGMSPPPSVGLDLSLFFFFCSPSLSLPQPFFFFFFHTSRAKYFSAASMVI